MGFWLDFLFKDKRFGWRFKIANLIMDDYLRNYLAVGVALSLDHAKDYVDHPEFCKKQIDKALDTISDLYEM